MRLFYINTDQGCCIREAQTEAQARDIINRDIGYGRISSIRAATEEDVSWVKGMGGYIPKIIKEKK